MQYVRHVADTIHYVEEQEFWLYVQWLNPGYNDDCGYVGYFDYLGIGSRLLGMGRESGNQVGKGKP